MQDNILSHSSKLTIAHLVKKKVSRTTKLIEGSPGSLDNNSVENFGSVIKRDGSEKRKTALKQKTSQRSNKNCCQLCFFT